MKRENIINQLGKKRYDDKLDIVNLNPRKINDNSNINCLNINDYDINKMIVNANKKDSVRECLRSHTPDTFYNNYGRYTTVNNLKKRSEKIQKLESYRYNYNELNNNYKKNCYRSKISNIQPGSYNPSDFSSEYTRMQNCAKNMNKKRVNCEDDESILNKSQDFPNKFIQKRKNNRGKINGIKALYTKNTSIINNSNNTKYNYFSSNIFFDKNKEKLNQQLLNNLKITKKNIINNKLKKYNRKCNLSFDGKRITPNNKPISISEIKKMNRDGAFPPKYANYYHDKKPPTKSIDEIYLKQTKKLYEGLNENQRNEKKYKIVNINNCIYFDPREFKRIFIRNGLHIYDERIDNSYAEKNEKGLYTFKIRKDLNDNEYDNKMKKIQRLILKEQGVKFNEYQPRNNFYKKKRDDISPIIISFRHKQEENKIN